MRKDIYFDIFNIYNYLIADFGFKKLLRLILDDYYFFGLSDCMKAGAIKQSSPEIPNS